MLNHDYLFQLLAQDGLDPSYSEEDTEIIFCDPICDDDEARLCVNVDTGQWICFHGVCGQSGGLLELLRSRLQLDGPEALDLRRKLLHNSSSGLFQFLPQVEEAAWEISLPAEYQPITKKSPEIFKNYLQNRGISIDMARYYRIGYCDRGFYAWRVIIPEYMDEVLYTFVARLVLPYCPYCGYGYKECVCEYPCKKVLTPKGGHPSLALFNYDTYRKFGMDGQRVVVVEGAFDCLIRPTETVALLGSGISPHQVGLLGRLNRPCVVALDGDEAGKKGSIKICDALASAMIEVYRAPLPQGSDPSSLNPEEYAYWLDEAIRYVL